MLTHNSPSVASALQNELSLEQPCGYSINGQNITLTVSAIANNRDWGNLSGSLTVELWALKQPYARGYFDGFCLAGADAGEILGQHFVGPWAVEVPYFEPPVGSWYLCLMLREWTPNGYETRDAINFDNAYHVNWKPNVIAGGASKVINVDFNQENVSSASVAVSAPKAKAEAKVEVETEAKANESAPVVAKAKPEEKAKAPVESKAAPKKDAAADKKVAVKTEKKAEATGPVSINEASLTELTSLKGMPKNVAKNIVGQRPYESLDDLIKVKGVGKKMLDKLRTQITL